MVMYRAKSRRVVTDCSGPSRTKQSEKDACDINKIVARHAKTGLLEHLAGSPSRYLDCTSAKSYHDSLNLVLEADAAFSELPADIRKKFSNDPYEMLEFVNNPENLEEMYELGMAIRPKVPRDESIVEKEADVEPANG